MNLEPRLIPTLLLSHNTFVKTKNFKNEVYVGDPLNVISIFNEFEVDEIMLIDIDNSRKGFVGNLNFLELLARELHLPLTYGGGLGTIEEVDAVIRAGFEKVLINSALIENEELVNSVVSKYGSQAVIGGLDYRIENSRISPYILNGTIRAETSFEDWCDKIKRIGVGEVLLTNIDLEGTLNGLDHSTISLACKKIEVPVIANGGAKSRADLASAIVGSGASASAAGTIFLMQQGEGSVLINYPTRSEIIDLFPSIYNGKMATFFSEISSLPVSSKKKITYTKMCRRCIITDDIPNSKLDINDVCYYCEVHDSLNSKYPLSEASEKALEDFIARVKKDGVGKKYDCIMGVSGGTDSSYLANLMVERGVRPLAVHFDNTWNSPVATSNIYKVLNSLGIDLETYIVDNAEYDDLYRSFIKAGVRDVEAPTDIGFMGVLYRYAEKYNLKHIIEGHSFRTEGVSPIGWLYMDGGYISDVQKKYGTHQLRTYPNMSFTDFLRWSAFSKIERTRPLYWIDYNKEDAKKFLSDKFNWEWYGGHHLENRFTAFYHTYFLPNRFGIDFRQIEFSALVRSGQKSREIAIEEFSENRIANTDLVDFTLNRLGYSHEQFASLMTAPKRTFRDFKTYKKRFEILRPFFWILMKLNRVPESFYVKFCKIK
jgi:N-acetyl sugar amidotransferase